MHLIVRESCAYPITANALYEQLVDPASFPLFTGFGPIPGIRGVHWLDDGQAHREGAVREVENLDGSKHRELVLIARPGELIEDRIYDFSGPFKWLVRESIDRLELHPTASGGCLLDRTFRLELRSVMALPLAAALAPALRRALRRHHQNLLRHVSAAARVDASCPS